MCLYINANLCISESQPSAFHVLDINGYNSDYELSRERGSERERDFTKGESAGFAAMQVSLWNIP